MAVNNEVSTIYPIPEIAPIAQRHRIPFLYEAS
jgi:cysteine sulfinate desulfinase/cysteine desulfurase-like protein